MESRRAHLPDLQSKKVDYVKDIEKFKALIQQLLKHKEQLEIKSKERKVELHKVEAAIQTIEEDISSIKSTIATQGEFIFSFSFPWNFIAMSLNPLWPSLSSSSSFESFI